MHLYWYVSVPKRCIKAARVAHCPTFEGWLLQQSQCSWCSLESLLLYIALARRLLVQTAHSDSQGGLQVAQTAATGLESSGQQPGSTSHQSISRPCVCPFGAFPVPRHPASSSAGKRIFVLYIYLCYVVVCTSACWRSRTAEKHAPTETCDSVHEQAH